MKALSKITVKNNIYEIKDSAARIAIADEITRAQNAERELQKQIDEIPTTGGGTGEIADGSVTEKKLSSGVVDRLNKAELADTLFVNDGIVVKIGAFKSLEEDIYEGTNYRAYTNHILENGETITLSKGYKFSAVRRYLSQDDRLATAKEIEDTTATLQSAKGITYTMFEIVKEDNTAFTKDELPNIIKSFKRNSYVWNSSSDLNNFIASGTYNISGERTADASDNMPIYNAGKVEARLTVLVADNCITQVLTLLNVAGGDGNVYTRTRQDGVWEQWGKLQTNIEVGLIGVGQAKTFDDLIDNGIYSGVNAYWVDEANYITGVETFVLVVINAYLYGGGVSQLKYSLLFDGTKSVMIRSKVDDTWGDWEEIGGGGSYSLPIATHAVLGGIKSATSRPNGSDVPEGRKCDVYVDGDSGLAHVVVAPASNSSYGVVKVDNSVDSESNNPVSGKAVADAIDTPIVNQTSTTVTIAPNVLNVWGEVSSLEITLAEADATKVNEYMFQFTSGATATTLVLPADIKWVSAPNIQANKTYQVSIINNLGVIGEFSHE